MDDVGPGQASTYGGEINTPTLTRIAQMGISFNRFHSTAMCSPTRGALLTGRNHTRIGNGQIAELANDFDGFSGKIPKPAATVAEVLKDYGYMTGAWGKWHNTPAELTSSKSPFDYWPTGYGFEYFYGFLAGEASQYEPRLVRNTTVLDPHEYEHPGYHLSEDLATDAIKWLREQQAYAPDKPFFMYWAPGAALNDTLIFYIWGDNGASAEGQNGTISELLAQNGIPTTIPQHIKTLNELGGLDVLGSAKTDNMYHAGWAWAGGTPYKSTKLVAAHFGGTRQPMAIAWPAKIKHDDTPRSQFHHVNDIVPTIYEAVGITAPRVVNGVDQMSMDGVSMVYTFADANAKGRKDTQFFDIMGSRGVYHDGWFADTFGPRIPWAKGSPAGIVNWNPQNDVWELYNLNEDWSQANDLAEKMPERVAYMKNLFLVESAKNQNMPIGGGLWTLVLHPEDTPATPYTEWTFSGPITGMPEFTAPKLGKFNNTVSMEVEVPPTANGVLYALGGFSGGLALYVKDGELRYEYNLFEIDRTHIVAKDKLPTGKVKIEVESKLVAPKPGSPLDVTLRVNGQVVAQGRVPITAALGFTANDCFDIGSDLGSPVSIDYFDQAPFAFNGKIITTKVKYPGSVAEQQQEKKDTGPQNPAVD
jgi:arylsulfatase A-like enzyme